MLKQCKLLYVEDEPVALEELSQYLKRRVGALFTARNGAEGLEQYRLHRPDIVVTDLRMPEMSGLEMLACIREMDRECRFVVVSALSDAQTILEAVDTGLVRYVVKPVVPDELAAVLEQAARDRLADRRIAGKNPEPECRPETEQRLRSETASFLKSRTGKGPLSVRAVIKRRSVELIIEGALTVYEQNLIVNNRNGALVAYLRSLFYQEQRAELERILSGVLGRPLLLDGVQCQPERNTERVSLRFGE